MERRRGVEVGGSRQGSGERGWFARTARLDDICVRVLIQRSLRRPDQVPRGQLPGSKVGEFGLHELASPRAAVSAPAEDWPAEPLRPDLRSLPSEIRATLA